MRIDALNTNMTAPVYDPARAANAVNEKDPAAEQQKKAEEERAETQKEAAALNSSVYGDVLSADEDGDTVAAKQQSLAALEDGMVFRKDVPEEEEPEETEQAAENVASNAPNAEPTAAEKLAEEEADKEREQDRMEQSLVGVSAGQLETMYLQGKISRYEYDQEIGRRDELMQKEEKPVGRQEEEEDEEERTNAQKVQEEINSNNTFTQQMGRITNATVEEDIRAEALKTANENDRVDLMTQVFDTN
ncbi:MAG: hypothetical protein J5518_04630 [Lachnospiraceae bacterium]|nr:hypothetical protein [Lachnospiraceae bacterium]